MLSLIPELGHFLGDVDMSVHRYAKSVDTDRKPLQGRVSWQEPPLRSRRCLPSCYDSAHASASRLGRIEAEFVPRREHPWTPLRLRTLVMISHAVIHIGKYGRVRCAVVRQPASSQRCSRPPGVRVEPARALSVMKGMKG